MKSVSVTVTRTKVYYCTVQVPDYATVYTVEDTAMNAVIEGHAICVADGFSFEGEEEFENGI